MVTLAEYSTLCVDRKALLQQRPVFRLSLSRVSVYQEDPQQSREWNRGAYLVEGLGHCNACHATRNILGATKQDDYGGGLIPLQNWYAPSLTSSRETGLGDWAVAEIVDLLRTGVSTRGAVFGPMSAVVYYGLQDLTIRRSWGNNAAPVGPAEVDSARGVPVD